MASGKPKYSPKVAKKDDKEYYSTGNMNKAKYHNYRNRMAGQGKGYKSYDEWLKMQQNKKKK